MGCSASSSALAYSTSPHHEAEQRGIERTRGGVDYHSHHLRTKNHQRSEESCEIEGIENGTVVIHNTAPRHSGDDDVGGVDLSLPFGAPSILTPEFGWEIKRQNRKCGSEVDMARKVQRSANIAVFKSILTDQERELAAVRQDRPPHRGACHFERCEGIYQISLSEGTSCRPVERSTPLHHPSSHPQLSRMGGGTDDRLRPLGGGGFVPLGGSARCSPTANSRRRSIDTSSGAGSTLLLTPFTLRSGHASFVRSEQTSMASTLIVDSASSPQPAFYVPFGHQNNTTHEIFTIATTPLHSHHPHMMFEHEDGPPLTHYADTSKTATTPQWHLQEKARRDTQNPSLPLPFTGVSKVRVLRLHDGANDENSVNETITFASTPRRGEFILRLPSTTPSSSPSTTSAQANTTVTISPNTLSPFASPESTPRVLHTGHLWMPPTNLPINIGDSTSRTPRQSTQTKSGAATTSYNSAATINEMAGSDSQQQHQGDGTIVVDTTTDAYDDETTTKQNETSTTIVVVATTKECCGDQFESSQTPSKTDGG